MPTFTVNLSGRVENNYTVTANTEQEAINIAVDRFKNDTNDVDFDLIEVVQDGEVYTPVSSLYQSQNQNSSSYNSYR